jgi:hypothetical protein
LEKRPLQSGVESVTAQTRLRRSAQTLSGRPQRRMNPSA